MAEITHSLRLSDDEIHEAIAGAIMAALSDEKRDAMLRSVVGEMLQVDKSNMARKKRSPLFENVAIHIREVARDEIQKIFDEKIAPGVRFFVREKFDADLAQATLDRFRDALAGALLSDIRIAFPFTAKKRGVDFDEDEEICDEDDEG